MLQFVDHKSFSETEDNAVDRVCLYVCVYKRGITQKLKKVSTHLNDIFGMKKAISLWAIPPVSVAEIVQFWRH